MAASIGIKGLSLQVARRFFASVVSQFTANTTVTRRIAAVPPGTGKIRVLGLHIVCDAIPSDADGTLLLTVRNRDISEGAYDTLVSAQDLETLVTAADRAFELTQAAEGAEKEFTLEEGDALDFQLVNNSAAIDVNPNVQVIVEYIPVPDPHDSNLSEPVKDQSKYVV